MDDIDLAREMIRLLGNEVKQLRQQCQNCRCKHRSASPSDAGDRAALMMRNKQPEEEVGEGQLRPQVASEDEGVKRIPLLTYSESQRMSMALQSQKQKEQEHATALQTLDKKYQLLWEKYQNVKESKNTLQSDLEESRRECQRMKESLLSSREQLLEPHFDAQQFVDTPVVADFRPETLDSFSAQLQLAIPHVRTSLPCDHCLISTGTGMATDIHGKCNHKRQY